MPAKFVEIFQQNNRYTASVDHGPKFLVGHRASYHGMVGITNDGTGSGPKYDYTAYSHEGHWAPFIYPTAICESEGFFDNVNTYDAAHFTFGFFQFAAHVPDGDFVRFFRRILGTGSGKDYFPDLLVKDGRIFRDTETALKQLEDKDSSKPLMVYLNPTVTAIEDIEVINAAKFIDGSNQYSEQREIQVDEAVNTARKIIRVAGSRFALDGMIDKVCLVILDIRHQGRGGAQAIIQALHSGATEDEKYNNLLQIGASQFPSRIATLKQEVDNLIKAGALGNKRYRQANNDFV